MTTDADARPREQCKSELAEGGSTYRCTMPRGHEGPHDNGDWEWHEYDTRNVASADALLAAVAALVGKVRGMSEGASEGYALACKDIALLLERALGGAPSQPTPNPLA